jgi:alkanesulfonate monooxygenase SsuD/methylene tetrahydromethanopterin reductase-like flavin-dependent oxidoreductase (luciferase family)
VLIAPIRPALLLAKTLATLDVLSGGRLDLGVGSGWQREEFEAAGVPFERRAARMDDVLRACRVLWRDSPASFSSPTVSFDEIWCEPRPVQEGGIPISFGCALGPKNVARIVEMGAGWAPLVPDDEVRTGIATLRDAFSAAGRDPERLEVRVGAPIAMGADGRPDLEHSIATLPTLAETGVTMASFALAAFAFEPAQIRPLLERLGRAER